MAKPTFDTQKLADYLRANNIGAMPLVRMCNISVTSAYKITKGERISDLTVLYLVYTGLKEAGYNTTWQEITGII